MVEITSTMVVVYFFFVAVINMFVGILGYYFYRGRLIGFIIFQTISIISWLVIVLYKFGVG